MNRIVYYSSIMQIHFQCIDYYHLASEKERERDCQLSSLQIPIYNVIFHNSIILDGIFKDELIKTGSPRSLPNRPESQLFVY